VKEFISHRRQRRWAASSAGHSWFERSGTAATDADTSPKKLCYNVSLS